MDARRIKADHQRLLNNLKIVQKQFTIAKLSETLGISAGTWIYRMKEPWQRFGYDDFRQLADYCKIDIVTLIHGELKLG
jgi:hypothetical protein